MIYWMMQPILIGIATLTISLTVVMFRAGYGVLADILQNRTTIKRQLVAQQSANLELSNRLNQTYLVLASSRRQARWREVMVVKTVKESEDVKSFYLVAQDYEPLPPALPGQHILVQQTPPTDSQKVCRCYSLSDDCTAGHWRISVKKSSDHPQSTSRWLHDEIAAGDILKVRGPSGAFYLRPAAERNLVFVSAGIGISPMLPMLIEATRRPRGSIHFFAQFRDVAHMPFADSLSDLAAKHPQIAMNIWISRFPKGVRRETRGLFYEGKFQVNELLSHDGAIDGSDYYLCGPEVWQDQIRVGLVRAGVGAEAIRYELFQQKEKPISTRDELIQHNIHFKQSNANARFESSQKSLLACAGQNSVSMESGCCTGACGSCAVRLLRGKVRYTREPQFPMQSSEILPCVCVPESDIEVDA